MIALGKENGVWTVRIDRPEKANALSEAMLTQLADIAEDAQEARALILTGTGRVFSAGADLDAAREGLALSPEWERLSGAIATLSGLSIAALNGTAAGGALGMVLACDLRIAVPEAKIFYPVMRLGFLPQPSDPARLTALIGPSRAKMILMAGQKIDARTAGAWGLVNALCASDQLMATAHALAADTLHATPEHATAIKGMIP